MRYMRDTLPEGAEETFINVNDGTCEGITYHDMPAFTVQFHPEACAGPKDTEELFGRFIQMMRDYKGKGGRVMPLNKSLKKVMVICVPALIVIGQAAEFDYAGTQACRALKEEGLEVVLVNSNPATIMTDSAIADHVYIEPLTLEFVKRIIEIEKPDSILLHPGRTDRTDTVHGACQKKVS